MKKYKSRTVTVNMLEEVFCDFCGNKIKTDTDFDKFTCEFKMEEGEIFPEGGSTIEKTVDFCQRCATVILDDFAAKKINISTKEKDY